MEGNYTENNSERATELEEANCSRDLQPELGCSIKQCCGHSSYCIYAIHRHFHSTCGLVGAVLAALHVEILSSQ